MQKAGSKWSLLFGVGIAMLATFSAATAWADCGGGPCSCGDTVTSGPYVLTAADPVVTSVCPPPAALFVNPGVNLNIKSAILRCDGSPGTVGVWILGDGVVVDGGSGIIDRCDFGIFGFATSNGTIQRVTVRNGGTGILLTGSFPFLLSTNNTLVRNLCDNNEFDGIFVFGVANTLDSNYCKGNGGDGIFVLGRLNDLKHNQGRNNGGHGVLVIGGTNTTDERNYGTGNATPPDCLFDGNPPVTANGKYC